MREAVYTAALIVMGGVMVTVPAAFSFSGIISGFKGIGVRAGNGRAKKDAAFLIRLAEDVRASGISAFEKAAAAASDPFLREALQLASGGVDADTLRRMLTFRVQVKEESFDEAMRFWRFMGSAYSAWGMMGALTGLAISASKNAYAADGLSVAIISAALGIFFSQCVAVPALLRVKFKTTKYIRRMKMIIEGLLSVKEGETPRLTGEKLMFAGGLDGGSFE